MTSTEINPPVSTPPGAPGPPAKPGLTSRHRRLLSKPEGKVGAACASVLVLIALVGGVIGYSSSHSSKSYSGPYGDSAASSISSVDRFGCPMLTGQDDFCTTPHLISQYCGIPIANIDVNSTNGAGPGLFGYKDITGYPIATVYFSPISQRQRDPSSNALSLNCGLTSYTFDWTQFSELNNPVTTPDTEPLPPLETPAS